ncbi:MAG: Uma2 family endonuclease [Pseudanabaenaceae cyanobacterium]
MRQGVPVHLNDFSEPQPDITILKGHPSKYYQQQPEPNDIILIVEVVEVADTTTNYDLSVTSVNIPEVWVVDINSEQCLVHRPPKNHIYEQIIIGNSSEILTLPTYPFCLAPVANPLACKKSLRWVKFYCIIIKKSLTLAELCPSPFATLLSLPMSITAKLP